MRGRQTLSLSWLQWGLVVLVLLAVLPDDANAQRRRTRFRSRSRDQAVQSDGPRGWVNYACGLRTVRQHVCICEQCMWALHSPPLCLYLWTMHVCGLCTGPPLCLRYRFAIANPKPRSWSCWYYAIVMSVSATSNLKPRSWSYWYYAIVYVSSTSNLKPRSWSYWYYWCHCVCFCHIHPKTSVCSYSATASVSATSSNRKWHVLVMLILPPCGRSAGNF